MLILLVYVVSIATAEVVGISIGPIFGVFLHLVITTVLLGSYALKAQTAYRRVLPVLLLAPLLRILSFVMPIQDVPQIYWYVLVGIPLLVAAFIAARHLNLTRAEIGLRLPSRSMQIAIALSGIPLGIAAVALLQPAPLIQEDSWLSILVGAVILVVFSGFMEEFIFRGLIQSVVSDAFGSLAGILISSITFTIMYFASLSISFIAFFSLVGLFFSFCVRKSGSIWGVTLAHSIMIIGMVIIWPIISNGLTNL